MSGALGRLVVSLALEYAAYTQGLQKSDQQALAFAKSVQTNLDQAHRATADFLGGVVTGALAAVASYQTVSAAINGVRNAIDDLDRVNKTAQSIGVAAEDLQALAYAGKLSDVSLEALATSTKRLSTFLVEAASGGRDQAATLKALGIEAKSADGSLRGTNDVLADLADKFAELEDGPVKTALAVKLLGKSGADMIPLLNGGADAFRRSADEARKFGLVLGAEVGQQAEAFNDNLTRLGQITQGTFKQIAAGVLPVLVSFTDAMVESASGTGSLNQQAQELSRNGQLYDWAKTAATAVTYVFDAVEGLGKAFKGLGLIVGAQLANITTAFSSIGQAIKLALSGDFSGAAQAIGSGFRQIAATAANLRDDLDRTFSEQLLGAAIRARLANLKSLEQGVSSVGRGAKASADLIATLGTSAEKSAKQGQSAFAKWLDEINKYAVSLDASYESADKLTKAEEWLAQLTANNTEATRRLTETERQRLIVEAQAAIVREQRNKQAEQEARWMEESARLNQDAINAARAQADAYRREAQAAELSGEAIGKTALEIARMEAARLRDTAAQREQSAAMFDQIPGMEEISRAYRRQAEELRNLAAARERNAVRVASVEQARELDAQLRRELRAWERVIEDVGDFLSDVLMGNGKRAWDWLREYIKRAVLQPIVRPIAEAIGGLGFLASGGGAAAANEGLAGGVAGGGNTLFGLARNMFGTAVEGAAAMLAGAAIGHYGGRAISGGFSAFGGSGNAAVNVGTAVGGVLGVPWGPLGTAIGSAIGGAIGGIVNRAFGTRLGEAGIQGTLGGSQGFEGAQFQDVKGGWFRSDRTDLSPIDEQLRSLLADSARSLQDATRGYALALGLPAQAIDGFTSSIRVSLKDLSPEEVEQKLQEAIAAYASGLAELFDADLREFSRRGEEAADTLMRLASSLQAVNPVLQDINVALLSASAAGGQAASQLLDMFGGASGFSSSTAAYFSAYFSEAERAERVTRAMSATLGALNLEVPRTRDEFRALVEAQDLMTEAGRANFVGLMSVAGAFDELAKAQDAAAEATAKAAQAAADMVAEQERAARALHEGVLSALDGVIDQFLGGAELWEFRASRIAQTLARGGIVADQASIIASSRADVLELWAAVGDAGRQAILLAYDSWQDLQQAILLADIGSTADELLSAYRELAPASEGLVQAWRRGRDEAQALADALAGIDGTQALSALDALRAAVSQRDGLRNVIGSNAQRAFDLRVGAGGQQALDLLRRREADLWRQFASTSNPEVASAITSVTLQRVKLEADLTSQVNAARIDALTAEMRIAERMRDTAEQIGGFIQSLQAGPLSNLSYAGRLDVQRQMFVGSLETGEDVRGQAQAYLQQAQAMYGGSTAAYGAIFEDVIARLGAFGLSAADLGSQASEAQRQIDELRALNDSSIAQAEALDALNAQLGPYVQALDDGIQLQTSLLREQLAAQQIVIANQERQILQFGEALTALIGEQAATRSALESAARVGEVAEALGT